MKNMLFTKVYPLPVENYRPTTCTITQSAFERCYEMCQSTQVDLLNATISMDVTTIQFASMAQRSHLFLLLFILCASHRFISVSHQPSSQQSTPVVWAVLAASNNIIVLVF